MRAQQSKKVVLIQTPDGPSLAATGAGDLVLHYGFCLYAASKGIAEALRRFRKSFRPEDVADLLENAGTFESRFGYESFSNRSRKYSAQDNDGSD